MLVDLISLEIKPDFLLGLEFKNGERRLFDMKPLLEMKPWNRIAPISVFVKARVDYGTVVWPGEIDIAPETLYVESVPITEPTQTTVRRIRRVDSPNGQSTIDGLG